MAQNTNVVLTEIGYTRTDYTALRAHVLKIPLAKIAELYYSEDSPQVQQGLERFLLDMRDDLVERAIEHNPGFAEILKGARQGGAVTTKALQILIKAADTPPAAPALADAIAKWLRPRTVAALKVEGVVTIAQLLLLIERRGAGWWRAIPRIGVGRAKIILKWLREHEATLGKVATDDYTAEAPPPTLILDRDVPDQLAPIGRFLLPNDLDGSRGKNRAAEFCFIEAANDLQAISCYLSRYTDQPHTLRAYTKEIERFLLWSVMVAGKPLSSVMVEDCKAYMDFLKTPSPAFMGVRAGRFTERWKPFSTTPLSAKSQRQAVLIIRAAFEWLARVRYLGGNPWAAVKEPSTVQEVYPMQIDKALPGPLWLAVVSEIQTRGQSAANSQERTALAALLMLGDSGLRRHEAAGAQRHALKPSQWGTSVWTMPVLGKRNKIRNVPVSGRTIDALRAHWHDRGLDFDEHSPAPERGEDGVMRGGVALLAPLVIPRHDNAVERHKAGSGNGYTADGLYRLIMTTLKSIRPSLLAQGIEPGDYAQLEETTPHALRHTFGTRAAEEDMPLEVVQSILGHASLNTTSIYVRTKEKRMAEEASKYFGRASKSKSDIE